MKNKILLGTLLACGLLTGCTENERAMHYGGNIKVVLPPGEVLEDVTWKVSNGAPNLWYMTRKREPGESPRKHFFREKSTYGMAEGSVTFIEQ
jgi:hypothetical protein